MNEFGLEPTTLLAVLVIALIIIIYLTWMVRYKANAKERLLIIEKDFDINKITKNKTFSFPWLKVGIVITCGAIGVLFGGIIEHLDFLDASTKVRSNYYSSTLNGNGMFALLFMYIFGGIGMILAYKIDKSRKEE